MLDNIVIRGSFIKCVTFKTNSKDISWQNKLFGVDGLFLMNSTDNMKLLRICRAFYLYLKDCPRTIIRNQTAVPSVRVIGEFVGLFVPSWLNDDDVLVPVVH